MTADGEAGRAEGGAPARAAGVPAGTRLAYGAPAFALAVVGLPVYVLAPKFYADVVQVPLATIGALVLAARLLDAVTDPLAGWLSDRTRTRWGRRRPWLVAGAPCLAVALVALFAPPAELTGPAAAPWLAASLFALFLAWTAVYVPYESLGLELSDDYDERTAVLGLRDAALLLGTVAAAVAPDALGLLLEAPPGADGDRARLLATAAVYAPLVLGLCLLCAARVPERAAAPPPRALGPGEALRALRRNRPFLVLVLAYALNALGTNLPGALMAFYVDHVLGSRATGAFLLLYFVAGIAGLPVWVRVARAWSKRAAWAAGAALNAGAFAFAWPLGRGDELGFALVVAASGAGLGATLVAPSSMQADVAEYDELLSGRRREALLVGVWAVVRKLSAALAVGLAFPVLALAGYVEGAPTQPPAVVDALRALYVGVPVVATALALLALRAYPLDRAAQARVAEALAARRAGGPAPA